MNIPSPKTEPMRELAPASASASAASAPAKPPADEHRLGGRERPLAQIEIGGETAMLTDRRLVVTAADYEVSLALAQIGTVRVRFERLRRAVSRGTLALAGAAVLALLVRPAQNLIAAQAQALAQSAALERSESAAALVQFTSKTLALADFGIAILPAIAGALALYGIAKIALAVRGRTILSVSTGGEEIELTRAGRHPELLEFGREVGRSLPEPRKI